MPKGISGRPDMYLEREMNCEVSRSRLQAGFTLVELMIAIAIVGILATIAVPNILGEMPKFRLNGATRQIAGHLMEARMMAVKQNKNIKVTFTDGNEYKICEEPCLDPNPKKINIQDNFNGVTTSTVNHPTFFPRGTATNETINISNSYGEKTITVAITGRVKIN